MNVLGNTSPPFPVLLRFEMGTGTGNRTRTHRNTNKRNESIPFADATIESVVMPSLTMPNVRLEVGHEIMVSRNVK